MGGVKRRVEGYYWYVRVVVLLLSPRSSRPSLQLSFAPAVLRSSCPSLLTCTIQEVRVRGMAMTTIAAEQTAANAKSITWVGLLTASPW